MPVYELRRFEVRCARCEATAELDIGVNRQLTPPAEQQIVDAVKRLDWRVRATNTPDPTFICPKHFEE